MMQAALEREVVSITLKPHCSQVVAVDALAQSCLGCIKSGGTLMSWKCVSAQQILGEMGNFSPGMMRALDEDFCPHLEDEETPLVKITQYFIKAVPVTEGTWGFSLHLFLKHNLAGGFFVF